MSAIGSDVGQEEQAAQRTLNGRVKEVTKEAMSLFLARTAQHGVLKPGELELLLDDGPVAELAVKLTGSADIRTRCRIRQQKHRVWAKVGRWGNTQQGKAVYGAASDEVWKGPKGQDVWKIYNRLPYGDDDPDHNGVFVWEDL